MLFSDFASAQAYARDIYLAPKEELKEKKKSENVAPPSILAVLFGKSAPVMNSMAYALALHEHHLRHEVEENAKKPHGAVAAKLSGKKKDEYDDAVKAINNVEARVAQLSSFGESADLHAAQQELSELKAALERKCAEYKVEQTIAYFKQFQLEPLESNFYLGDLNAFLTDFRLLAGYLLSYARTVSPVKKLTEEADVEKEESSDKASTKKEKNEQADPSAAAKKCITKLIESVFKNRSMTILSLNAQDATVFLEFVRDILFLSVKDSISKGAAGFVNGLMSEPLDDQSKNEFEKFFTTIVRELNTHNSKITNAAASYGASFIHNVTRSRFLNSQAVPPLLSGTTNGGLIKLSSWLIHVLPFVIELPDKTQLSVCDILTKPEARKALIKNSIDSFESVPLVPTGRGPAFNGHLVPAISVKVNDEKSQELRLVPSNGMIKLMAQLTRAVRTTRRDVMAVAVSEHGQAVFNSMFKDYPANAQDAVKSVWDALYPNYYWTSATEKKAYRALMLNELNALLVAEKCEKIDEKLFLSSFKGIPHPLKKEIATSIHNCGSKVQNLGAAYQDYCHLYGNRGLPRFYSYRPVRKVQESAARNKFFVLEKLLQEKIDRDANYLSRKQALTKKYNLPKGWGAKRTNEAAMGQAHIELVAETYLRAVFKVVDPILSLSEDEKFLLEGDNLNALQRYALAYPATEAETLEQLAKKGLPLLNTVSHADTESFIGLVTKGLAMGVSALPETNVESAQ